MLRQKVEQASKKSKHAHVCVLLQCIGSLAGKIMFITASDGGEPCPGEANKEFDRV